MPDVAKRLHGPAQLSGTAATLYTAPIAVTTIVREVTVCNTTGSAATLYLSIGTDADGTRAFSGAEVAANTTVQLTCFWVLAAGEIIEGWSGTASALTVAIHGIET